MSIKGGKGKGKKQAGSHDPSVSVIFCASLLEREAEMSSFSLSIREKIRFCVLVLGEREGEGKFPAAQFN